MIRPALDFLRSELGQYVQAHSRATAGDVQLGNVADQDGKIVPGRLTLTLVNVEEETVGKQPFAYRPQPSAEAYSTQPSPLAVNLYVLATACVQTNDTEDGANRPYEGALSLLSTALEFFQANPHFNHANFPTLDTGIDKLLVVLVRLSLQDQQNLWSYLGAKYMPSALFRVRLVTIDAERPAAPTPAITTIDARLKGVGV